MNSQQLPEFLKGWIASEQTKNDVIAVRRAYIDIANGNLTDGVMLSQILYWSMPNPQTGNHRLKIQHDGHHWLAKSYSEWFEECRIKERNARDCVKRLEELGIIVTAVYKFDGTPTKHIRINWENFNNQLQHVLGLSNEPDGLRQIEVTDYVRTITETTTETTTGIKSDPTPVTTQIAPNPVKWLIPSVDRHIAGVTVDPMMFPMQCENIFSAWKSATEAQGYIHTLDDNTAMRRNKIGIETIVLYGYKPDAVTAFIDDLYQDEFWAKQLTPVSLEKVAAMLPNSERTAQQSNEQSEYTGYVQLNNGQWSKQPDKAHKIIQDYWVNILEQWQFADDPRMVLENEGMRRTISHVLNKIETGYQNGEWDMNARQRLEELHAQYGYDYATDLDNLAPELLP